MKLLHKLTPGPVETAGRFRQGDTGYVVNAHATVAAVGVLAPDGALVRVSGVYDREVLRVETTHVVHVPTGPLVPLNARSVTARAHMYKQIRDFFAALEFIEVETPNMVTAAGTDPFLEPVSCGEGAWLHTSPEFAMKTLLAQGMSRIYQICKVYRSGEITSAHNPEFTILEFYRAWEGMDAIIDDVEALVRACVPSLASQPFRRVTMQALVMEACGVDVLACATATQLRDAVQTRGLFTPREGDDWYDIFFELMVTCVDPYLTSQPPTFVTHWPSAVAVLARRDTDDPRAALRFELYVGGLEVCNGFEELTDPIEQAQRFAEDQGTRARRGMPFAPMPSRFLEALAHGMPPSAGVAIGLDRLLMLATEVGEIGEVLPFWWGGRRI